MSLPIGIPCSVSGCAKLSVAKCLCATHYKRWQRYGDVGIVNRPSDWGSKEKHPLYLTWYSIKRYHNGEVPKEWETDFWQFVADVVEKPENARFCRLDNSKPYSKNNICWVSIKKLVSGPGAAAKRQKEWRKENPRAAKAHEVKRYYGIGIEEYEALLDRQDHKCAICKQQESSLQNSGKPFSLAVDHCHDSKKVRGLLCSRCNRGIGIFKDNIATLLSAVEYLKKSSS